MNYPTMAEVEAADRVQICIWWRKLKSPGTEAIPPANVEYTDAMQAHFQEVLEEQSKIMDRIAERFKDLGGFTPAISKAIGW